MAKSTNFIQLDIESAKIVDVQIAADDPTLVMGIRLSHPNLPGLRWLSLNSKDTGYISRYTKTRYDQNAECYCINNVNPRTNANIVAARFTKLDAQFMRGLVNVSERERLQNELIKVTRWTVGSLAKFGGYEPLVVTA